MNLDLVQQHQAVLESNIIILLDQQLRLHLQVGLLDHGAGNKQVSLHLHYLLQ